MSNQIRLGLDRPEARQLRAIPGIFARKQEIRLDLVLDDLRNNEPASPLGLPPRSSD